MDSGLLGSLGSGMFGMIGNLVSTSMTNKTNRNIAASNNMFNYNMWLKQLEAERENWRMVQDYNLPSAQLQRIIDAHMNPLLLYGEGGVSAMAQGSIGTGQRAQGTAIPAKFGDFIGEGINQMIQAKLANAQAKLLEASANKTDVESENIQSQTEGQNFLNWLNDHTRNIQLALKYRDYDYVNSVIDKNRNEVFQSNFRNATEVSSLALMNTLAIRRQNLSEYEVGENIKIGWQNVANGKIMADASLKNAFAAMMNASTAARLSNAQIGLMRQQTINLAYEGQYLKGSVMYRIQQQFNSSRLLSKEVSWYDILHEAGISESQSRIFLNNMSGSYQNELREWKPIDELMTPVNMLTGFGAGMLMKGNFGRMKVKGF